MKTGTSAAILVTDLLTADGPAAAIADDFVALRCSACAIEGEIDMAFLRTGYLCAYCGALATR